MKNYKKILVLGSGALKIGQAGEFDYSGSQAIKALREEGVKTILINPNIATIQTSEFLADEVYFLPVNEFFVEKVIEKERPDGILLSFGGQTALNCGIELYKKGVLTKNNVEVLGTSVESIILAEDRQKFANFLRKMKVWIPESRATSKMHEAAKIADEIGYPVMVRAAFALGGQKSGIATNKGELENIVENALSFSPQVLIEKYLHHYKEIEYEVVRDIYDNCVAVCNMENMDPLGIHTGESIVVAPSQTLTNHEYHTLRKISIEVVRKLNVVGECNVQFAVNPKPENGELEYYVIELNPRLSRSSALASKATGYPLAYVAAKLALGKGLFEIKNQVTHVTQSFFEPALDYVVVKIPKWDLAKFSGVGEAIGSSMKSVGEVMGIGRTFEEAFQKGVRMLQTRREGVTDELFSQDDKQLLEFISNPTTRRSFAIAEAIRRGLAIDDIYNRTGIDKWFLFRIKNIVDTEKKIDNQSFDKELMLELKQLGCSDRRIGKLINKSEDEVRIIRKSFGIIPSVFQIDTLAGEVPAKTNYLYTTYNGFHNDVEGLGDSGVMVLGSGPYRIGSSVEFDWTCVNTAKSLKKYNKKSIIINCNPETVSTDYDISDRLYFEELSYERIADIYEFEKSSGVIVSVGGQIPNNLVKPLSANNIPIFGTSANDIDMAEDRSKFSQLLDSLSIPQPQWNKFSSIEKASQFAERVGYPVLIRPSYVLSGSAMAICFNSSDLIKFIEKAVVVSKEYPITVSKFISDAREIEIDGVAQNGKIKLYAMSEHIENAGVHSGDASIMYPPYRVYVGTERKINDIANKLCQALHITGPFNIQFLAFENKVYVIEMNVRSSRTFPFISKATGVNFAEVLVDSFFGKANDFTLSYPDFSLVKVAQFSFSRLEGADPVLNVEMASTGEAACFGEDIEEAFLKAEISVGAVVPQKGIFLSLGSEEDKVKFLISAIRLSQLGLPIYATENTAIFLRRNGVKATKLHKIFEGKLPNALTLFEKKKIDLAINITDSHFRRHMDDDYVIRRAAIDHNINLITNRQKAELFVKAISEKKLEDLEIISWREYLKY